MPRKFIADLRTGQVLKWNVVRGKCSGGGKDSPGYNHESVRLVGTQWMGESSGSLDCPWSPKDLCPLCDGLGYHEVSASEAEMASLDGEADVEKRRKPCGECKATGLVPGPHTPWRHPHPGPVMRKRGS